jgi:hypothetical protein
LSVEFDSLEVGPTGKPVGPTADPPERAGARVDIATARVEAEMMRRRLAGRPHGDSGAILAEERQR